MRRRGKSFLNKTRSGDRQRMADYQHMYYILCDAASRALDALEKDTDEKAQQILQDALDQAEEMYVSTAK